MRRVMIVGQPGAGKSTLAREIGAITHLPVVHIDLIHWRAGWVERTGAEFLSYVWRTRRYLDGLAHAAKRGNLGISHR